MLNTMKQTLCHVDIDHQIIHQLSENTMYSENELAIVGKSCFEFIVPI